MFRAMFAQRKANQMRRRPHGSGIRRWFAALPQRLR
jgi:hypothetical protein